MGDFNSFSAKLYNTVKPEYRSRIFYGNEDSAFDILMNICDSAIWRKICKQDVYKIQKMGFVRCCLKFCFSVHVDTWTKIHNKEANLTQVKNALLKKYNAASAKVIDSRLSVISNMEKTIAVG